MMLHTAISRRALIRKGLVTLAMGSTMPGILGSALAGPKPNGKRGYGVATSHAEGDKAALRILKRGGNAVDAAVGAMMALCVVLPGSVGFAGYGGSMVIHLAGQRRTTAIDFDSRAPLDFRPGLFNDSTRAYHGYLAAGVPGVVAGFDLALRSHGRLSWKIVSESALELAENGFVITPELQTDLESLATGADSVSVKALFPAGKVPVAGEVWCQPDLANVIKAIGTGGVDTFYRGEIARKIVRQVRANGGILSEQDFHAYRALATETIRIRYRGNEIHTPPPPSGGITSLSILKTLENFDVAAMEPWGAVYFHLFAEVAKLCWAERFQQCGDPDIVKLPVEELLSADRAARRAQRFREGNVPPVTPREMAATHTANVVVADQEGNVVSLTATHGGGFGSHVAIDGLGLILGHGMSRFTYDPKSPNYPAPGKRMQHNMSPAIILRDGQPRFAVGLPGGRMIVTVTAQLAVDLIDFHTSAARAVVAPRIHTEGDEPLRLSPSVSPQAVSELSRWAIVSNEVAWREPRTWRSSTPPATSRRRRAGACRLNLPSFDFSVYGWL